MKIEDSLSLDISMIPKFDINATSKDVFNFYQNREEINELNNYFWPIVINKINNISSIYEQRDNLILTSKLFFRNALYKFNKTN